MMFEVVVSIFAGGLLLAGTKLLAAMRTKRARKPPRKSEAPQPTSPATARSPDTTRCRRKEVTIDIGPMRALEVIQVQPAFIEFEVNDFDARARLLTSVINWAATGSTGHTIERTAHGDSAWTANYRPATSPWLMTLPELFLPSTLVPSVAAMLEPGQIFMTGVNPTARTDASVSNFFTVDQLQMFRAELLGAQIEVVNPELVDELVPRLYSRGGGANLALTLVGKVTGGCAAVLHAKTARSHFERGLRADENSVEADSHVVIRLRSAPLDLMLLPLICSDFCVRREASRKFLLEELDEDSARPAIDLISVINVQPIKGSWWPEEVQRALAMVATFADSSHIQGAHVLLTNVGEIRGGARRAAGESSIAIVGSSHSAPEGHFQWIDASNQGARLYGAAALSTEPSFGQLLWYDRQQVPLTYLPTKLPRLTLFRVGRSEKTGLGAIIQRARLRWPKQQGANAIENLSHLEIDAPNGNLSQ